MRRTAYHRGRKFEYRLKKFFERNGAVVLRTAGSHSPFDLVVIEEGTISFIQCKIRKSRPKKDLEDLKAFMRKYFQKPRIKVILAWQPPRKRMVLMEAENGDQID